MAHRSCNDPRCFHYNVRPVNMIWLALIFEGFGIQAAHHVLIETDVERNRRVFKRSCINRDLHAVVKKKVVADLLPMLELSGLQQPRSKHPSPAVSPQKVRYRKKALVEKTVVRAVRQS